MKTKRALTVLLTLLFIALLTAGCAKTQQATGSATNNTTEEPANETTGEQTTDAENKSPATPTETKKATTSTKTTSKYIEPEASPSKEEKDVCRCSFTWDPVCGKDDKTYINKCLYQCFGGKLEDIKSNAQCPKKNSPINIYTDDVEFEYEADKWNGGYCWRQMYQESGIRYCKNIIINGRVNEEPSPAKGNWLDDTHLALDKAGRAESYTIKLATGEQATNEEYDILYQPLFESGKYRLSFWARRDTSSNNDWKVELSLKDWWETKPMPVGVEGCYKTITEINGNAVYAEEEPTEWRHYHYEFDVPLNVTQWNSMEKTPADCADWDMMPHGYGIKITGPTVGDAYFDDFVVEKIK